MLGLFGRYTRCPTRYICNTNTAAQNPAAIHNIHIMESSVNLSIQSAVYTDPIVAKVEIRNNTLINIKASDLTTLNRGLFDV